MIYFFGGCVITSCTIKIIRQMRLEKRALEIHNRRGIQREGRVRFANKIINECLKIESE